MKVIAFKLRKFKKRSGIIMKIVIINNYIIYNKYIHTSIYNCKLTYL
jgi:hypothetical protein